MLFHTYIVGHAIIPSLANVHKHPCSWDERQFFPKELLHQAGDMGFMGVLVPETYGGAGLGYFEYTAIIEEISKVDPSIGLSIAAHNSLCTNHILTFGDESQKQRWLPKLATANGRFTYYPNTLPCFLETSKFLS